MGNKKGISVYCFYENVFLLREGDF